jgi:CTP:molybdopterin cytidylyltransferase MocA/5'-deoxynucleotidase YfbR-like HD superfamily hydrolase
MERVAAIVLAAGLSSRLPGFKPLIDVEGRTLLERAVGACADADFGDVLVVTGHRGAEVAAAVERLPARIARNEQFARGMYSSVQAGVRALPSAVRRFFVLPVDCAFVRPETLGRLARAAEAADADVVYPVFGGGRGHPPLLSAALAPAILAGDAPGGLRGLLERDAVRSADVTVTDAGVLFDADTPADLGDARALGRASELPGDAGCAAILAAGTASPGLVAHSRAVAAVAGTIGAALNECGQHLCLRLVAAASMLHDVARSEPDHAEAGARRLESLGYPRVAEVVRRHVELGTGTDDVAREIADVRAADVDEAAVVYIADKLVLGDRVVALNERFAPRLRQLEGDPSALAAARARLAAASEVLGRVETILGRAVPAGTPE